MARDRRQAELAKIHLGRKQLGLDEASYRAMLWRLARVRSAADLDAGGRQAVLAHLRALGFRARPGKGYPGRPAAIDSADRGPQLRKIEALLADAGRPWAYADALAERICGVERVGFCKPDQLGQVIAALQIDADRRRA